MDSWIDALKQAIWTIAGGDEVRLLLFLVLAGVLTISYFSNRLLYAMWKAERAEVNRLQSLNLEQLGKLQAELLEIRIRREYRE